MEQETYFGMEKKDCEEIIREAKRKWSEQGIQLVKYLFADMLGNNREVTLTVETIKGIGATSVDGSSAFGKIIPPTESDMILLPDPRTFARIPWASATARAICNVFYPPEKEGEALRPFEGCGRNLLAKIISGIGESLASRMPEIIRPGVKLHAHFAPEIEFLLISRNYDYLQLPNDPDIANKNYFIPTEDLLDQALAEMIGCIGEMGLKKEKYHSEVSSCQYEIGIMYGNALEIADATMTLKYIIKHVARRHGLIASFIPKFNRHVNGSGMHVHQNLAASSEGFERNLFYDEREEDCLSWFGRSYIAGLLRYARDITAITNPGTISYKRLVPGREAPTYITWDWLNRTALCRGHSRGTKKIRVEYRSPDPICNPYLAFAAMLSAGLAGIDEAIILPPPDNRNFYTDHDNVLELPGHLGEALGYLTRSTMLRQRLGDFIVDTLYNLGMAVWRDYCQEITPRELKDYFEDH